MNDSQLKGKWQQLKGSLKTEFGKLTDDDIDEVNGRRENLIGKIRERYGDVQEVAANKVNRFLAKLDDAVS